MKKRKSKLMGALKGFVFSLILLALLILFYYTTVSVTLHGDQYSFIFKFFVVVYGWPFIIIAFLFNIFNVEIFNPILYFIISSGTYTLIGVLVENQKTKKRSKGHRHRRRTIPNFKKK